MVHKTQIKDMESESDSLSQKSLSEVHKDKLKQMIFNTKNNQPIKSVKVVFIGNGGCGKTSLIKRIQTGDFRTKYIPTMGVEVFPITEGDYLSPYIKPKNVVFNVWDCAGQEKFAGFSTGYYRGAHTFVICFTRHSRLEYESIKKWVAQAKSVNPEANFIYMGTKSDIMYKERKQLVPEVNVSPFVETSAKTCHNFEKVFQMIHEWC